MRTWQIFSDAGNTYRWVISGRNPLQEESHKALIHHQNPNSSLPSMEDLLIQESRKLFQNCGSPIFSTGSGKLVEVKQSSLLKASSTHRGQIHATNNGCSSSNSLFRTGSGKMVNLSSAGLTRAKTLLALEESSYQFVGDESNVWENLPNLKKRGIGQIHESVDPGSILRYPVKGQTDVYSMGCEQKELLPDFLSAQLCNSSGTPPPVMFQTSSGRSISVSNDALQRAISLLRDSELGNLASKGGADAPQLPLFEKGTSNNKENDLFASCLQHESSKKKFTSKTFPAPKANIFKQNQGSTTIKAFSSRSNLGKQVSENDFIKELDEPNFNIASKVNSLSTESLNPAMRVEDSLAKIISPRTNTRQRPSVMPLVDVSNDIGLPHAYQTQIPHDKTKLVKRSTVSPFKRPRNNWLSTPKS